MKRVYNKRKLDTSKYANIETGELLSSEIPNLTSTNEVNNDLVIIDSKEYIIIDSKAREYITKEFNKSDVGRIIQMTDMVNGIYNLLHNKNKIPHTKESLMTDIEYSRNKFHNFLKRLLKKSLIAFIKSYKDGEEKTFIMLNPFLARKSKTFHKDCTSVFEDIRDIKK